ncbi:MAG: hypothetical protein LKK19_05135 [Bacteroidales bacterium]|jgi:hypothetical protein|nr:hypothetical protein [Bacteroidales bacterium]MCI2122067.1 hypothetical protein [Bacteroidales bacterium]MCI2146192.1 hypothetical protein [Bacteroidales bacterium]
MDGFEEKIRKYSRNLDTEEVPAGNLERFENKLSHERNDGGKKLVHRWKLATVAACLAIVITTGSLLYISNIANGKGDYQIYAKYMDKVGDVTEEIARMSPQMGKTEYCQINATLINITSEPIHMEEQLPDYLSTEQKKEMLSKYYGTKLEAVRELLSYAREKTNDQ